MTWFGPLLAGDRLIVAGTNEEALAVSPYTGDMLGHIRAVGGCGARWRRWWRAARC